MIQNEVLSYISKYIPDLLNHSPPFITWLRENSKYVFETTNEEIRIIISVFDKLIWRTIGPNSFLFGTAQFSLWGRRRS